GLDLRGPEPGSEAPRETDHPQGGATGRGQHPRRLPIPPSLSGRLRDMRLERRRGRRGTQVPFDRRPSARHRPDGGAEPGDHRARGGREHHTGGIHRDVPSRRQGAPRLAGGDSMPLLTVKGLKTHFETRDGIVKAVDGVDFTLGEGESLGLAGESGCGKTTAALSIMRLLPSNGKIVDGTIDYLGYDLATIREAQLRAIRWKHISIIFQGAMNALNPVKRV